MDSKLPLSSETDIDAKAAENKARELFSDLRCNLVGCETNGTKHTDRCPIFYVEMKLPAVAAELADQYAKQTWLVAEVARLQAENAELRRELTALESESIKETKEANELRAQLAEAQAAARRAHIALQIGHNDYGDYGLAAVAGIAQGKAKDGKDG